MCALSSRASSLVMLRKLTRPLFCAALHHRSHFWVTDSLPHVSELSGKEPFEVLSIAPAITEAFLR